MRTANRLVLIAPLLLAGCVSQRPLRTPSGNPEIVVHSARPPELVAGLRDAMLRRGYRVLLENDRLAMFAKDCGDFDTAFFYGQGWNASADFRVTFYLAPEAEGLRVVADIEIVTKSGTPEEARKSAPQGLPEAHEIQRMLELLQGDLALKRHEEQWPDEAPRPSRPTVWTGGNS